MPASQHAHDNCSSAPMAACGNSAPATAVEAARGTPQHAREYKGFGTKAIHVGQEPEQWAMNQIAPDISLSTTYKQTAPGEAIGHAYSRCGNPTRDVLERNLACLESAKHCRVFSSGMSTVMVINNYLKCGDHVLCSDDVYGGVKGFFHNVASAKLGREVDFVDMTDLEQVKRSLKKNTRLVWLETPANPTLKVIDIRAVVQLAKQHNERIVVVADNTFMTPYFQRPLTLGVDVVVHSCTKYINGHTDVTMGAAATNSEELAYHLSYMQKVTGAVPSPFDVYLCNRGVKTLHVRMERHYENGLAVARFLESHPRVERVNYPALPSHPQHKVHTSQTTGMSGMLSFYIRNASKEDTWRFLGALQIFTLATSLGGIDSLADMPRYMSHGMSEGSNCTLPKNLRNEGITDGLVRLSVGIEDKEDLLADLAQALEAIDSTKTENKCCDGGAGCSS